MSQTNDRDAGLGALPALDDSRTVAPEQVEWYRHRGYLRLNAVCSSDEIAIYRPIIVEAAMRNNRETRPLEERDTYGKAFLQIMNLWTVDHAVRRFVLAKRFASIAAQLMECDSVRLYHDQALFKEPGGGHTPWHQDQFYWPLSTPKTVTLWMPLVEIDDVMGSMTFAEGSHLDGWVKTDFQISDESDSFYDRYVTEKGFLLSGGGAMAAGDATFHSGYTLHKAPGNSTQRVREVMTIIYMAADNAIKEPENEFQAADLKSWLDSKPVGSYPDGPLNPIVWP